jgi:hypothetical protein
MGNDLGGVNTSDFNSCMAKCNTNKQCAAVVWQPGPNVCYPKNSNAFPKGQRQPNPNLTLAVRKPQVVGASKSCSTNLTNIDTIQYTNYYKGNDMTATSTCGPNIGNYESNQMVAVDNKLSGVTSNMAQNQSKLQTNNININNQMNTGKITSEQNIGSYYQTQNSISKLLGGKKEPMLNMEDLNAMISDTDILVLRNNYQYILWSIVALGTVILTVNTIKK